MHRLAHGLVAAEGEGEVGDTARNMDERHTLADRAGGLDEIDAVIVVFLDPGRHGEDVRVEDDILRREADRFRQQLVGALAYLDLALVAVRLARLVEGHDDDRGTVVADQPGLVKEVLLTLLERDRIDDPLALYAFQPGLDDLELGGIDHHRHLGDVGLGGDEVEELDHRPAGIDQPLVHVDVDDLRAVLHLVARDGERRRVVARGDQLAELGRAGDIRPLADVDEGDVLGQHEGL